MSKLRPTRAFLKRLEFLSSGRTFLKESVKTITLAYDTSKRESQGLRTFISQELPPIQYKNSNVQVVLFKNTSHFPCIKIYFDDSKKVTLDAEGKTAEDILSELSSVASKSESQVQKAQLEAEYNPSLFGDSRRGRLCICEVPGQTPCPSRVPLPKTEHKWHDKTTT